MNATTGDSFHRHAPKWLGALLMTAAISFQAPAKASCGVASGDAFEKQFWANDRTYIVDYVVFGSYFEIGRNQGSQRVQVHKTWDQIHAFMVQENAITVGYECDRDPSSVCTVSIYVRRACSVEDIVDQLKLLARNAGQDDIDFF